MISFKLIIIYLFLAPSFAGFRSSLSNDIDSSTIENNFSGDGGGIFSDGEIRISTKQQFPNNLKRTPPIHPGFDPSEESDFY